MAVCLRRDCIISTLPTSLKGGRALTVIWRRNDLTPGQKLLLLYLGNKQDLGSNFRKRKSISQGELASAISQTARGIRKHIDVLERKGLLLVWRDRGKYAKIGFQLAELLFITENCSCCWSDRGRNSVPDKKPKPELSSALDGLNRNSVPTKPELSSYNHNSLHNSKREREEQHAPSRPPVFSEFEFLQAKRVYLAAAGLGSLLPDKQLTKHEKAAWLRVWTACGGSAEKVEETAKIYLTNTAKPSAKWYAEQIEDLLLMAHKGKSNEDDVNWIN